jgi:hypothetical protein
MNDTSVKQEPNLNDEKVMEAASQIADGVQKLTQEMEGQEVSPEVQIAVSHILTQGMKDLRFINSDIQKFIGGKMKSDGNKMAVVALPLGGQVTVEQVNKSVRKDVDREALISAVNIIANENKYRVDTATGQLSDVYESRNRLYQKCFRMEPRWTELREIGIDDDEFCLKSWDTSIKITQGGSL